MSFSQEMTLAPTETLAAELPAKFRTGRILPDVLSAQRDAEWNQQKAAGRAVEGRMKRNEANSDARPRQLKAATRQSSKHVSSSEHTQVVEISPLPSSEMREQPRADVRSAEGVLTASTMMPTRNRMEVAEHRPAQANDEHVPSGVQRRAKRRGLPIPLSRGKRWKRRLPKMCW